MISGTSEDEKHAKYEKKKKREDHLRRKRDPLTASFTGERKFRKIKNEKYKKKENILQNLEFQNKTPDP